MENKAVDLIYWGKDSDKDKFSVLIPKQIILDISINVFVNRVHISGGIQRCLHANWRTPRKTSRAGDRHPQEYGHE